jgi:hypothetical protein
MIEAILGKMGINLDGMKDEGASVLAQFPPDWCLRVGAAFLLRMMFEQAVKEGPPPDMAEKLGVTAEQAAAMYAYALKSAITRTERIPGE